MATRGRSNKGWSWAAAAAAGGNSSSSNVWAAGVTIGAFGPAAERPLLTGTAASAATVGSELLRCVDVQALRISGISFALTENALNLVYTQPGGQYANVTIQDCHFREIMWANFSHRATGFEGDITTVYGGGNAVRLVNSGRESCLPPRHLCDPPTLSGLTIKNSLFEVSTSAIRQLRVTHRQLTPALDWSEQRLLVITAFCSSESLLVVPEG